MDKKTKRTDPPSDERKPLLEIQTLAPVRPFATIDDHRYEFRLLQDFGATEHQEWVRESAEYDELWKKGTSQKRLTKQEEIQRDKLLERLLDMVLGAGAATLLRERAGAGLTAPLKREIVLTFSNAPWLIALSEQQMAQQTDLQPGDSSTMAS